MHLISPGWGPLDTSQALQALSDTNPDFTVIGICSAECSSVNSTTVASTLAAMLSRQQKQHAANSSPDSLRTKQLHGLQIHVHPSDHVIVLDASNILSPDLLSALLAPERPQPAVGSAAAAAVRAAASKAGSSSSIPVEGVAALLGLQLLVFMVAVCNVVVISSPEYDAHLLQLLEAAGLLATSIPDITLPAAALQQQQPAPRGRGSSSSARATVQPQQQQQQLPYHLADLVLVQCCKQWQWQQQMNVGGLKQLQQCVDACLAATVWASRPPVVSEANTTAAVPGIKAAVHPQQQQQAASKQGVSIWAVPALSTAQDDKQQQQQRQHSSRPAAELQQLVNKLLCMPRTVNTASGSSSSSGCFARVISGKEWLRGAERIWETVQNSSELLQYYSLAAVARYPGAGGWRQR